MSGHLGVVEVEDLWKNNITQRATVLVGRKFRKAKEFGLLHIL